MKGSIKKLSAILLTGVMAISLLGGCAVQRKPLPDADRAPAPAPAPSPTPAPGGGPGPNGQVRTPEATRDAANDLAMRIEAVKGIKEAWVAVVGNVALVGLDIGEAAQEQGTNDAKAEATKRAEADARIVKAYVTADPDIVPRIREIADGIQEGRPVTEFLDEISEIIDRLAPSGDRVPNRPGE